MAVYVNANEKLNKMRSANCPLHTATWKSWVAVTSSFGGELEARGRFLWDEESAEAESISSRNFFMKRKKEMQQ